MLKKKFTHPRIKLQKEALNHNGSRLTVILKTKKKKSSKFLKKEKLQITHSALIHTKVERNSPFKKNHLATVNFENIIRRDLSEQRNYKLLFVSATLLA